MFVCAQTPSISGQMRADERGQSGSGETKAEPSGRLPTITSGASAGVAPAHWLAASQGADGGKGPASMMEGD